ncbi:hypothetical protein BTN50_1334 [Candidatus Enterovibrio altilux]|uniref:Uncharacterized protein n=1 Tax=Candidatus Enterovibrio altilux TaxID=1927128 RepID=A0A291BA07_9GAMM|nr:hypothetical protein BTN50_1334 [Candidatus Enterovibrio luxaltus]
MGLTVRILIENLVPLFKNTTDYNKRSLAETAMIESKNYLEGNGT